MKNILLAGATGFLGNQILQELGKKDFKITALSRSKIKNIPENAQEKIIDFDCLEELNFPETDHVYLALGRPMYLHNLAGMINKDLKKDLSLVDYEYQLQIAKKALEVGAKSITLISAIGSSASSINYYLKIKGKLEEEIVKLSFNSINIFRPGHIVGNKNRFDTILADLVSAITDPFLIGPVKKFRSISIKVLPKVIVTCSLKQKPGVNYFEFGDFQRQ